MMAGLVAAAPLIGGCAGTSGECENGRKYVQATVPAGSSFASAADSLERAGVVSQAWLFRVYAKMRGRDRDLKPGRYFFACGDTDWSSVLARLSAGPGERTVTIPEGFAISDIVPLLAKALGVPEDSVRVAASDSVIRRELDVPTPTLEGYLFPDTYRFAPGSPARDAIGQLVRRFRQEWNPAWDQRLQRLALSRHDILTLASIIEKEARLPEERPVISAVYHNRLRDQMPLQADPTVQYALGQHVNRVRYKDLEVESPYNTYKRRGLPPGPIASPGRASIEAALFPADVPYKFFVAHPDGHHEFRTTFREHTEARAEIRQAVRARPR